MLSRRVLARVLVSTPARRWATNKTTTGIVGLEVEPNAHILLRAVYEETLKKLKAVPDSYGYKTTLSALVNERLAILQSTDDHAQIEAKFDNGRPIEESLAQAKQENELIDVIVAEKFWTNVKPEQVEIIVLPPGVHHEDRLELVRDQPKPKAQ
jgi:NADH dehydrogenase (ubiquinone) 1 alpha subcomplex subunit 5